MAEDNKEFNFPVRWAGEEAEPTERPKTDEDKQKDLEYQLRQLLAEEAKLLTLDEVLNHRDKIIKVYLTAYDRAVEVHPLLAGTFLDIVKRTEFKGKGDIAGGYALALEACEAALVDENLKKNLNELDNSAINEISEVVMRESELPKEKLLKNLSSLPKGKG